MPSSKVSLKKKKKLPEDLPNPQNFIPGYTKPVYQHSQEQIKKSLSQGNSPNNSRRQSFSNHALLSVGIQALSLAIPTAHKTLKMKKTKSLPTQRKDNQRPRSVTFESSHECVAKIEQTILPYKIVKKEFADKKKWRSLEQLHRIDQTTAL